MFSLLSLSKSKFFIRAALVLLFFLYFFNVDHTNTNIYIHIAFSKEKAK